MFKRLLTLTAALAFTTFFAQSAMAQDQGEKSQTEVMQTKINKGKHDRAKRKVKEQNDIKAKRKNQRKQRAKNK